MNISLLRHGESQGNVDAGIDDIVIVSHGVTVRAFVMMWSHKTAE